MRLLSSLNLSLIWELKGKGERVSRGEPSHTCPAVSQTPSYRGNVTGAEAPQQTGNAGLTNSLATQLCGTC